MLIAGCLALVAAAPVSAHDEVGGHRDTRAELASVQLAGTVNAIAAASGTEGEGLPVTWCGTERTTDDVTDPTFLPSLPQFKVVYAYPSDRPDRFAQWRDALQADVSLIGRFMSDQSGGRKAPRFDMGTDCGPEYLDIQVVALPAGRATYVDDFTAVESAVRARLNTTPGGIRNVVVLADTLSSQPVGNWWGLGMRYTDDDPTAANAANLGDLFAALWVPDGEPAPAANPNGWWPEGMLHEMTHTLGAVQWTAPHTTHTATNGDAYGHCWDGYDVMCYRDGPFPAHDMTYDCPKIAGVMSQVYDCGGDDYFNVAPPANSYLATHWNIYDSIFLGSCAQIAPACGGTTSTPAPTPPVSTAEPELLGTARRGYLLAVTPGTWTNSPQSYAYQWERGDGAQWTAIAGATSSSYLVDAADVGLRLRARVVATNADGSALAVSAPSAVVESDAPAAVSPPASVPPAATAPPPAAGPVSATTALKIAIGRGRGRRLSTVAFSVASGRLRAATGALKLARGRYELALCTTAGGSTTLPRCVRRRLRVKRTGRVRPPALTIAVPAGSSGRATLTVSAVGRLFAARTAKRPALGVLLHA
jgi:hypothetical protein